MTSLATHTGSGSFSPSEKCAVRNLLNRKWRPHIARDEHELLSYIIDNSIEWGRAHLDATFQQIHEGIPNTQEDAIWPWRLPPLQIARATFYRIVNRLKQKGLLVVETVKRGFTCFTRFAVNLSWTPSESGRASSDRTAQPKHRDVENGPAGNTPKNHHIHKKTTQERYQGETVSVSERDPYKQNVSSNRTNRHTTGSLRSRGYSGGVSEEEGQQKENSPAEAAQSVQAIHDRVLADSRAKKSSASVERRKKNTIKAYRETYETAWAETFPGIPCHTWGTKTGYIIRSTLTARIGKSAEARHDFLDFAVRNWQEIMVHVFSWMRSETPKYPTPKFLCSKHLCDDLIGAYAYREHFNKTHIASVEKDMLTSLLEQGMSREDALMEVGRRRSLSEMTEKQRALAKDTGQALRRQQQIADELTKARDEAIRAKSRYERERRALGSADGKPQRDDELLAGLPKFNPAKVTFDNKDLW